MKEGTPLKEHLNELNSILMELCDIDVKMENGDLTIILLASLPPSYENFVSSLKATRCQKCLSPWKTGGRHSDAIT